MKLRLIGIAVMVSVLVLFPPYSRAAGSIPTCGQVRFIGGEGAECMPRGGDFWSPLKIYRKLHHGEVFRTDARSRAELALAGGVTVRIDAMSVLELLAPEKEMTSRVQRVRLPRGTIWFHVEPLAKGTTFVVETPEAAIGLKGTAFVVSRNEEQGTMVEVHEGAVAVWNRTLRKSRIVREGYEVICRSSGGAMEGRPVPTGLRAVKWHDDVWFRGDPLLTKAAEQKWLLEHRGKNTSMRKNITPYGLLRHDFHYAPGLPGASERFVEDRMDDVQETFRFMEDEARDHEERFDGFIEDTEDSLRD